MAQVPPEERGPENVQGQAVNLDQCKQFQSLQSLVQEKENPRALKELNEIESHSAEESAAVRQQSRE